MDLKKCNIYKFIYFYLYCIHYKNCIVNKVSHFILNIQKFWTQLFIHLCHIQKRNFWRQTLHLGVFLHIFSVLEGNISKEKKIMRWLGRGFKIGIIKMEVSLRKQKKINVSRTFHSIWIMIADFGPHKALNDQTTVFS